MNKRITAVISLLALTFMFTGCSKIGDKSTSVSIIYGVTVFLSFLLLIGYLSLVRKKEGWFYFLFASVFVVNVGYLSLSLAKTLDWALYANRIAYLGSVFLPFVMFMIIINVCKLKCQRYIVWVLFAVSMFVFLVAASPGYLDIYYKSVDIESVNGMTVLVKEYGSWHVLYLFYLLTYFALMIGAIIYAAVRKKLYSTYHAVILLVAVFVNICVWLLEQLVQIDFEFLSVSYIVSELFLLSLYLMLQEAEKTNPPTAYVNVDDSVGVVTNEFEEKCCYFRSQLSTLTPTERSVYKLYTEGKGTKEVLEILNIKENTLKYHNKNIYSKLGVNSRKLLLEIARTIKEEG